jgi:hypothetical protein
LAGVLPQRLCKHKKGISDGQKKKKRKRKKGGGVDGKLRNEQILAMRRRRRFQTSMPLLIFLAFSTCLTRIASPGPMSAFIQIVHLRASSTPVNNKNQHGT